MDLSFMALLFNKLNMRNILLLVAIILNSFTAFGYNKKNHALITERAIFLLNERCENFITAEEANLIIEGNVSEDRNLFKMLIRLWNQHFYNPLKPREFWLRDKSIDVRFERIAKRWFDRPGSDKDFSSIGEIVHHIQDCTNPAHVVPVYHGGCLKDEFDEQDISAYLPRSIQIETNITYREPYLSSILGQPAIQTLESIRKPIDIKLENNGVISSRTIDWSYFWMDNPNGWFGEYGFLGNNYLYEKIPRGDTLYMIDKSTYDDYSSKQIELAVIQTANFIYFAKTQLQKTAIKK